MQVEHVVIIQEQLFSEIHLVFGIGLKTLIASFEKTAEGDRVVIEHKLNVANSCLIGFPGDQARQGQRVFAEADGEIVAFVKIEPDPNEQVCIFFQIFI